jgi:hypothetical protein
MDQFAFYMGLFILAALFSAFAVSRVAKRGAPTSGPANYAELESAPPSEVGPEISAAVAAEWLAKQSR